ncbi:sulfite exporter TauE/SafE family protein [Nesterenkonia muleiensis]|uniref:sulfite exporter TauE/SafE family protein n=1 Tax=Nesterenkonia muleiensis TaxID=2282648 RepID=UPI000E70FEFF|nr:sulfite exporter TauE/SafE family protein [Nesterenkonia muleiensis]
MIELDASGWALLGCAAVIVGASKTMLPGAATLAVALFAAVLPARESTAALLILLIVGDLFAIWMYRKTVDWTILRRLIWPVIIGVAVGTVFLGAASDGAVRRVIGVILLALLGFTLWRRRRARTVQEREPKPGRLAGYGFGSLGGFTTMVANAGGPVMSMYLLAMRLPVTTFLGTTAYFFFTVNVSKIPFHIGLGLLNWEVFLISATLIPMVVVAAFIGRWFAGRISQKLFERLVLVLTAVGAVNLLL